MRKIIFVDQNQKLVGKVSKAIRNLPFEGVSAKHGDIFAEDGVIVSASNPSFSCGAGLDRAIVDHGYTPPKNPKKGNQRIGNVIWTVTVDENIKSSRELVASALEFAFSKIKKNETLLITGLGTGIGGLDEDDFVWLFLSSVINHSKNYGWGIKYTRKDGFDFYSGTKKYQVGKWLEEPGAIASYEDCGVGLHLGKDFVRAGNYNIPEKIFFCIYDNEDLCNTSSDKVRVKRLLPLYRCPKWLGYGLNGKKVLRGMNKPNLEKYNPYRATKLPSKAKIDKHLAAVWDQVGNQVGNQVRNQVRSQVWNQVGDQVWSQVWNQVGNQVGSQVWSQVWNQVRSQVGDQVGDQVWNQVWDQVGDQVWDQVWSQVRNQVGSQVRATSYWAVNLHFSLGVLHPFFDFLKLGVMIVFVQGKMKVFGKNGKFLGEYDELKRTMFLE